MLAAVTDDARARRLRLHTLAALAAVVALVGVERAAATNVWGTISANTTWTAANSPYVMTGNVTVASGVTLTIEPGVTVQGNAQSRLLTVNGSLSAVGSAASRIVFTSTLDAAPAQWGGITFSTSAGTGTLQYVDVRYGGGSGTSHQNGMVTVSGGTITIEDSTFRHSSVSGVRVSGGTSGTASAVTIVRSKFESNGFVGTAKQGNGLFSTNGNVSVDDSAFWSNARDGANFEVGSSYTPAPPLLTDSSFWDNERYGVFIGQGTGAEALGPDGSGNAVYDNGTFGLTPAEKWHQLFTTHASTGIDWSNNYWGPVAVIPCGLGIQTGHLSYGAPDPDPSTLTPVPRGPVRHRIALAGTNWCANDDVVVDPPSADAPNLYFDPPPPTFGGVPGAQGWGCVCTDDAGQAALSLFAGDMIPFAHTQWPVNTATGSLTETATDLRLAGPGIPFEWTRTYNSADASSGALGKGWSHPFQASLTVVNSTTQELEYRAATGQRTRFVKTSGGSTGAATYWGKGFDGTLKRLATDAYELVARDQRVFSFDPNGNLTQIKPRFLPATTLTYANGKLASITDSAGRTVSLTYSSATPALIERVTLPDARYVQYGYTNGRLTSVQDARAKTWQLAYDANERLTSIQDPLGRFELQDVLYDAQGRVTSEKNGAGDALTYAYTSDDTYQITTVTVPGRGEWTYKHRDNLLFKIVDPLERTTTYRYDMMARTTSLTDARGKTRRYEYDASGNVKKETPPAPFAAQTVTRTFNASNDLLTETDGRGNTTSFAYATAGDAGADYQLGQLKTVTDREAGVTIFKYWTTSSSPTPPTASLGLVKSIRNPRGKWTTYDYDAAGNLTGVTSPLGLKTTMGYDSSGRLTSRRDPRGNAVTPAAGYRTEWTYDAVDHIATLTDARGTVTSYDYYNNELLWKETQARPARAPPRRLPRLPAPPAALERQLAFLLRTGRPTAPADPQDRHQHLRTALHPPWRLPRRRGYAVARTTEPPPRPRYSAALRRTRRSQHRHPAGLPPQRRRAPLPHARAALVLHPP